MVKKTFDTKIKENLQPFLKIREIDSRYQNSYKQTKKDKHKAN